MKRNGRKVATLGPGAIVGELSLLDHGPRTATAVCETDCSLFVISQRHFLAVLDDVPTIGHKLLAALAGRIRELDRAVLRLSAAAGLAPLAAPASAVAAEFGNDESGCGRATWSSGSGSPSRCSPCSPGSCP